VTLVADRPEGPFYAAEKNFRLLSGHTYFSRFFPVLDGVLVNHHSIARDGEVYFAPLKQAVVDDEGILRLGWWSGNEEMKHEEIDVKSLVSDVDTSIVMLENTFAVDRGMILEGEMTLPNGLYIECEQDQGAAIMIDADGPAELGQINRDGSGFQSEKQVDREMSFGEPARFRLLLENSLLEFYLDDILIECFSLPARTTGRIGVIRSGNSYDLGQLQAWQ
jgi:hypothetical protein